MLGTYYKGWSDVIKLLLSNILCDIFDYWQQFWWSITHLNNWSGKNHKVFWVLDVDGTKQTAEDESDSLNWSL